MKKTLAAVAVLGAFAGSALAADVTVYGRLDTGLLFNDYEHTVGGVATEGTDWSMESGNATTSRIGIKGSEQISEDLTVGFVLEKKVLSDTGAAGDGFDRESSVYAKTNFGTIYAGRINSIYSDGGSTGFFGGKYVAFGSGNSVATGYGFGVAHSRADNRVSYISPEFAGFKVYADYSFGADDAENTSGTNRPAALGLNYANGAFGAGMVVTYNNEASWTGSAVDEQEDEYTVGLGTSYDFGVAKVMLAGQYYKNADTLGDLADVGITGFDELEGYYVTLGADVPAWGGTWTLGVAYGDGEDKASDVEFKGYNAAAMYQYYLSKQVKVYGGLGYTKMEADNLTGGDQELEAYNVMAGMAYYF